MKFYFLMVGINPLYLAFYCFIIPTHDMKKLSRNTLAATFHGVNHQKNTNLELSIARNKDFTVAEYLRKLTQLYSNSITEYKVTSGDNTRVSSNLLLKSSNEDFNSLQKETTDKFKPIKPKYIEKEKYQDLRNIGDSEYSIEGNDMSASELHSAVYTTIDTRRIYHGHKTKIKHFPFLVTVHVLGRFICSGSIIRSNLVITAASCLNRWQEWQKYQASNKTHAVEQPDLAPNYTNPTDDFTTVVTANTATETIEDDTEATATGTDETNTAKDDNTITPTKTETFETIIDATTPEVTTETTPETSTWSETPRPKLGALAVRIGTNYYRLGGKVVHVVKVYFHPSYVYRTLRHNLAILRLERHVNVTRRRVQVVNFTRVRGDVPEGTEVTIAGWGAKLYHNKVYNALWNLIHKAVLTVSSRWKCSRTYSRTFVQPTNFCALSVNREGACNRDIGNPAIVGNLLVGVTSFGSPKCGAPDAPTVFTNLGYYAPWIDGIIDIVKMDDPTTVLTTFHDTTTVIADTTEYLSIATTETVDNTETDLTERRHWLNMKYKYFPRSYRRSQNLSESTSIALLIGTPVIKEAEKEWSIYNVGPVITITPEKFIMSLGSSIPPLSVFEEMANNNFVLKHISTVGYGTLNRPVIALYRPNTSIAKLFHFTPHAYVGKNSNTTLVGSGSKSTERYWTTVLTTEENHVTHLGDYKEDKSEVIQTTNNKLSYDNDDGVTHPFEYQIESPTQPTLREIKNEMVKIIGQLDDNKTN